MSRRPASLGNWLLGANDPRRLRVSQSLLAMPGLLLIQALLILAWRLDRVDGTPVAWFIGLTTAGCILFYVLVRCGLGERLSDEPSLSAPQMMYGMICVIWGYMLAGPFRSAVVCLMPLIMCFGIFSLPPQSARVLLRFGIVLMGLGMTWLVVVRASAHEPLYEAANWVFMAASMAMIQILSNRLGQMRSRLSVQKAELSEALERVRLQATRDTLTGLLTRRAAHDELRRAAGQAARNVRPLLVAMVDLDHFKQINDSFGHQAGDGALQAFAQTAGRELRSADRLARWGGEEFLLVMPDTDEHQAFICLDRLRSALLQLDIDGVPSTHRLSFSAGVALCTGLEDIEAAIDRADRAMYSAKLAGRDRTHCQSPVQSEAS